MKARQPSLARTLVEHQADLVAKDSRGLTLLQAAVLKGDSYAAEFIIEQLETSGNAQRLSDPLCIDATANNIESLKQYEGCTVLHVAAKHNNQEMLTVASKLLQAGIDQNLQDNRGW